MQRRKQRPPSVLGNWRRFVFASDIHGIEQDKSACEVLFKFCDIWKPEIRICGGDLFDFSPLRKGASEDERRQSIREDFNAGKRWFNRFRATHFLRGNHDERIYDLATHGTGIAQDYAIEGVGEVEAMVAHHKCKMLPYHKRHGVLRIGSLKAIHGFHSGAMAARQTALIYGACIFGHIHSIDEHAIPGLERRVARSSGCLCSLDLSYASRTPSSLRQNHGFIYGVVNKKTGAYVTWSAEEIEGTWLIPSDIQEL